jgi:hypothetical protein
MTLLEDLPDEVLELMRAGRIAQYATVSAAGMPIDTPVLYFPSDGLRSLDLATGLAYPAKAERARRNPKVGLLLEGGPDEPVISVAGMAAVRDADLQANVDRYLAECCYTLPHDPDWALARQAVWYWTRMIVEVTPARVLWWDNRAEMDSPPRSWRAPPDTVFPKSDPPPLGATSRPAKWASQPWAELARQAVDRGAAGHLSVIDDEGFPLPMPVRSMEVTAEGFALDLPRGIPWPLEGSACLTFGGVETFLGQAESLAGQVRLRVERSLPVFPMTRDMTQLWEPTADTRAQLMRRLEEEAARRGQAIPAVPLERPPPSEGYRRRMARMAGASTPPAASPPPRSL